MPYSLRPTARLLPPKFYALPDDLLYTIALVACVKQQQPCHRYRLRQRRSASRGTKAAPCVRPLSVCGQKAPLAAGPLPAHQPSRRAPSRRRERA